MSSEENSPEMRLFSPTGVRLYLTAPERDRFLKAANDESPVKRMVCIIPAAAPGGVGPGLSSGTD
ncbi:hypothetical protein [Thalassomonas sp. RHCl1]|uniref:hypothetical protein n=1 Tax=Thalassomonas sp. RHCl1 TaxID=2995320 RepID=UPI00248AC17E|nr:hypothetical protein [Thalassomonas sp. RHCl1]